MLKNLNKEKLYRFLLFTALIVISVVLSPREKVHEYSHLQEGFLAPQTIIAPFDYEIVKSEKEINYEREKIKEKVIPRFDFSKNKNIDLYNDYLSFLKDIDRLIANQKEFYSFAKKKSFYELNQDSLSSIDSVSFLKECETNDSLYNVSRKEFKQKELKFRDLYKFDFTIANKKYIKDHQLRNKIKVYLRKNRFLKFLNIEKGMIFNNNHGKIIVIENDIGKTRLLRDLTDFREKSENDLEFLLNLYSSANNDSLKYWNGIINHFSRPNLIYNAAATNAVITLRKKEIPLAKGLVKKGDILTSKNMIITKEVHEKLISLEKKEKEIRKQNEENVFFSFDRIFNILGKIFLAIFPTSILFLLLYYDRKSIYNESKKMLLLVIIIIMQMVLVFTLSKYLPYYSEYLVFIPATAMLMSIFFDTRVAFMGTVVTSIFVSLIMSNSFNYLFISLAAGLISIYSVNRIRDRFQLFYKSFIYIFTSYIILAIGTSFISSSLNNDLTTNIIHGIINSFISPILTFGLVALIEIIFKMPTDITLLELSDMTKPLLKKLQIEAPGTYHHSIVVGNLAEAASEAVGANSLLARVGSYYHDIGKTFKPDYFIENINFKKEVNKHDKLPPNMSALILSNHVKEGVKLAKDYKLPQIIIDFIATHHGTSRMEFFYNKALKTAEENGEKIDESVYRYPGPKPQTKETAILMISDIVEAKSRTVSKPDYDTYRHIINEILQDRFREGELDECDLKLHDLTKIREAMLPVIMGMYHSRIKYPDKKKTNAGNGNDKNGKPPKNSDLKEKNIEQEQKKSSESKNNNKKKLNPAVTKNPEEEQQPAAEKQKAVEKQ